MHKVSFFGGPAIGLALLTCCIAGEAAAAGFAGPIVDMNLSVTSDYVFRGVSQTLGEPAVQTGLDMTFDNGLYASAWASNVDFVGDGDPDDGAELELDLTLGYAFPLGRRLSADLAWVSYRFPGTEPGIDYNYAEWIASLNFSERFSIAAGYSDDVFGEGEPGWHFEASGEYALPNDLTLGLSYGRYDLEQAYGASYRYADLMLTGQAGAVGWTVSYHDTSSEAESLFHATTVQPRVVLSLNFEF